MSTPIRVASVTDIPAILPLMEQFNAGERIPWRPIEMSAAFERLLRDSALGLGLVALDATGRVLGYALGTYGYDVEFAGADAFVTELFVDPSARKRGIGRGLLDALIAELRARDVKAVHLMVRPENERAHALYESLGFRDVPRLLMTLPFSGD